METKTKSPGKQPPPSPQNASGWNTGRKPDPLSKGDSPPVPSLPPEETMKKDVWGYLPDSSSANRPRQYYKAGICTAVREAARTLLFVTLGKKNKK